MPTIVTSQGRNRIIPETIRSYGDIFELCIIDNNKKSWTAAYVRNGCIARDVGVGSGTNKDEALLDLWRRLKFRGKRIDQHNRQIDESKPLQPEAPIVFATDNISRLGERVVSTIR